MAEALMAEDLMAEIGFCLFETAVGACAIAWGEAGRIKAVQLPGANAAATRRRVLALCPGAKEAPPPAEVRAVRDLIIALLAGEPADLSGIRLDMDTVPPFHRQVYAVARQIKPGETLTYGEVAKKIGMPGAAQAVGQALGKNPFPIVVPCHRVLAKGGKSGGFSAPGGVATKLCLLAIEGADGMRSLFD